MALDHVGAAAEDDIGDTDDLVAALFHSHQAPMVRLAHLLTGSNAVAQEIVQDAFLEVHRRWRTLDNPRGYLRTCVVNRSRSHLRRRIRERDRAPEPPGPTHDPELDETWHALARLRPRQRAALVLRFYEDLTVAEVARTLGCAEGTAKSLIHRGLKQLKEVLEP